MSDLFTVHTLVKACLVIVLMVAAYLAYGWALYTNERRWQVAGTLCLVAIFVIAVAGCGTTVQPVRYQPVTVVTTKPCLAGKPLPPPATVRTQPACEKGRVDCLVDAAADIEDLKREAEASRRLLKECSR